MWKSRVLSTVLRVKALLPQSRFLRSVAVLAGGTAVGQVLLVLVSPVLTRMYSPESFGVLGVYSSVLAVLLVVASGRYHVAIPVPNEDESAVNLLVLAVVLNALVSIALIALLITVGGQIASVTGMLEVYPYLKLLPLGLIGAGTYQAFNYWSVRKEAYALVARTKLSQSGGQILTQLGLGYLGLEPIGLIMGDIVGRIAGSGTLGAAVWRDTRVVGRISAAGVFKAAKRFRRFPLYSVWSSLLNSISSQIPILSLSAMYDQGVVGFYALTLRSLQAPMTLVGNAIAQVFFANIRQAQQQGRLPSVTLMVFTRLAQVGLPVLILTSVGASSVFALIFGHQWREAGVYAQWLSPWLFLVFVSSPLSTLVYLLEHQRGEFLFQAVLLAARVMALIVGGRLGGPVTAIAFFGSASAILWMVYLGWIMNISGNSIGAVIRQLSVISARMVVPSIPAVLARVLLHDDRLVIAGLGISGCLIGWRLVSLWRKEDM